MIYQEKLEPLVYLVFRESMGILDGKETEEMTDCLVFLDVRVILLQMEG